MGLIIIIFLVAYHPPLSVQFLPTYDVHLLIHMGFATSTALNTCTYMGRYLALMVAHRDLDRQNPPWAVCGPCIRSSQPSIREIAFFPTVSAALPRVHRTSRGGFSLVTLTNSPTTTVQVIFLSLSSPSLPRLALSVRHLPPPTFLQ